MFDPYLISIGKCPPKLPDLYLASYHFIDIPDFLALDRCGVFDFSLAEVQMKLFVQPYFRLAFRVEPNQLFAGLSGAEKFSDQFKTFESCV